MRLYALRRLDESNTRKQIKAKPSQAKPLSKFELSNAAQRSWSNVYGD